MKPTYKRELNLYKSSLDHQSSVGCGPCFKEALKIDKQINGRSLNDIKIDEIKKIVRSIFETSNDKI